MRPLIRAIVVVSVLVVVLASCAPPAVPPPLMSGLVDLAKIKPEAENLCALVKGKIPMTPRDSTNLLKAHAAYDSAKTAMDQFITEFKTRVDVGNQLPSWIEVQQPSQVALEQAAGFLSAGNRYLSGSKPGGTQAVDSTTSAITSEYENWLRAAKEVIEWAFTRRDQLRKDQLIRVKGVVEGLGWKSFEKVTKAS